MGLSYDYFDIKTVPLEVDCPFYGSVQLRSPTGRTINTPECGSIHCSGSAWWQASKTQGAVRGVDWKFGGSMVFWWFLSSLRWGSSWFARPAFRRRVEDGRTELAVLLRFLTPCCEDSGAIQFREIQQNLRAPQHAPRHQKPRRSRRPLARSACWGRESWELICSD